MDKDFNFENALKELEKTVETLEKGDMPLNESIEVYKKGITLAKDCSDYLENAKQKISEIKNGEE